MIYESGPWKEDLRKWGELLEKYNTKEAFAIDEEKSYQIIEKSVFYSAFIIRKLIDCKIKVSEGVDNYSISTLKIRKLKDKRLKPLLLDSPCADSYDWENQESIHEVGVQICNQLIHSHYFFTDVRRPGLDESAEGFFVASDRLCDELLYYISMKEWLKFIWYVANDDIESISCKSDNCEKNAGQTKYKKKRLEIKRM